MLNVLDHIGAEPLVPSLIKPTYTEGVSLVFLWRGSLGDRKVNWLSLQEASKHNMQCTVHVYIP